MSFPCRSSSIVRRRSPCALKKLDYQVNFFQWNFFFFFFTSSSSCTSISASINLYVPGITFVSNKLRESTVARWWWWWPAHINGYWPAHTISALWPPSTTIISIRRGWTTKCMQICIDRSQEHISGWLIDERVSLSFCFRLLSNASAAATKAAKKNLFIWICSWWWQQQHDRGEIWAWSACKWAPPKMGMWMCASATPYEINANSVVCR